MSYACTILADSISEQGHRLTTIEATIPRFILAEFNTHRMLSRNSASSRAIPLSKQIERVSKSPFIPQYWGLNQAGMQASEQISERDIADAKHYWLYARDIMVSTATKYLTMKVHKQISSRLLEVFGWHTIIATATEWDNFFNQRTHPDAQPEFQVIATLIKESYSNSTPKLLHEGDWHLPLCEDADNLVKDGFEPIKVSIGRCARVSYLTHDGKRDPQADIDLFDRLQKSGHMSPMEHAATPFCQEEWTIVEQMIREAPPQLHSYFRNKLSFDGNLRGFRQYRKLVPNEDVFRGAA